jgi:hypothetical protein
VTAPVIELDPLFADPSEADAMLRLCEDFGRYGQYLEERSAEDLGGQYQRFDSAGNYIRSGGRLARRADAKELAARTSYFRESYAYGDDVFAPGIEPFWHHQGFVAAARSVHGLPIVVPAIAYANVMLPGQELAVHTDVPEFRGANRKRFPQWLMVVMHHSGCFDRWRLPIATGIAYFGDSTGGALAYWPDGPDGPVQLHEPGHNRAVVLDTDSVFHGVDCVGGPDAPIARIRPGCEVVWEPAGRRWLLRDGSGEVVEQYSWDELRFSVSWKAYCFADEAQRELWRNHDDDLSLDVIVDTLVDDLRNRGRIHERPADDAAFARLLVDSYVRFPAS